MDSPIHDISCLLDRDIPAVEAAACPVAVSAPQPSLAEIQARLARELLQAAEAHDAWIEKYMGMYGRDDAGGTGGCPG